LSLDLQESRARKPRDAAAVLFGLKFADNSKNSFQFYNEEALKIIGIV